MDSNPSLEVFLKQQFQFWYYVRLLVHLGLANADMSASFVRLLRALEATSLQPLMPIRDVAESGWSIKHIMLDSMDKVEGLLKLPRPSSTTMAGRIVEVAIVVTKLLDEKDKSRNKNEPLPTMASLTTTAPPPPAASSLFGRLPMPPPPPIAPSSSFPFTDMRDEYFQGACDASSVSAETLFGIVRFIAPEAAFSYSQPIPATNMPVVVCCVAAWGLGSKAMRVPPVRLASLTYNQIVNVLVLSGTALHRSTGLPAKAAGTAANVSDIAARLRMMRPTPSPCPPYPGRPDANGRVNGGMPPRMPHWVLPPAGAGPYANYQNRPALRPGSSGPGPVGPSRPPMYRPPQPYPVPGQPRPTMTGGRGGPLVWREPPPLLGPRRPVPPAAPASVSSSESDGSSDSELESSCPCAKKTSKKDKTTKCKHHHHSKGRKNSGRCAKDAKKEEKESKIAKGVKAAEIAWDGSDSEDSTSEADVTSSSETDSDSDSDSSLVRVDAHSSSDLEADSDSGCDSDDGVKEGHRKSRRSAKTGKSEKRHCHKCRHDMDDFVMVRDKRREAGF